MLNTFFALLSCSRFFAICFFRICFFIATPQLAIAISSSDSCGLYTSAADISACTARYRGGHSWEHPLCTIMDSAAVPTIALIILFVTGGVLIFGCELSPLIINVAWGVGGLAILMLLAKTFMIGAGFLFMGIVTPAVSLIAVFASSGVLFFGIDLPEIARRLLWMVLISSSLFTGTGFISELGFSSTNLVAC